MAKASIDTKQWRDTLVQLPSVISVEFACEGNTISEIHVLSDSRRQAKQISRDIQSAMAAKFGVTIDYKIISVAQIASNQPRPQERVIYSGFESLHSATGYTISVKLQAEGVTYEGSSAGVLISAEKPLAIARATADALNKILSDRGLLTVEEVRSLDFASDRAIMVSVVLDVLRHPPEKLVGCCYSRGDNEIAVIRATLDAVNRRLETI